MVLSKLAQYGQHMIGSILRRWSRNPRLVFADSCCLLSLFFARLKYIPYSNNLRIVFSSNEVENLFNTLIGSIVGANADENNTIEVLHHTSPDVAYVLPVLIKIVQALSNGLGFKNNCTVSAYVGPDETMTRSQNDEDNYKGLIVSRCNGKERVLGDDHHHILGLNLKYDIEHLDGLNWKVFVAHESEGENAFYCGNGMILIDDSRVHSVRSEAELACTLAREVGHGVARHVSWYPLIPLWLFVQIPWTSAFWCPAFILKLLDLMNSCSKRMEAEADYIGLMLMASAGYDPRQVPQFWQKHELDDYVLETTHPTNEQRAKMLSRADVMNRAVKIYEQVQAAQGITTTAGQNAVMTAVPSRQSGTEQCSLWWSDAVKLVVTVFQTFISDWNHVINFYRGVEQRDEIV